MTGDPQPADPAGCFSDVFDAYFAEIHRYAAKHPVTGALLAQEVQLTRPGGAYAQQRPGFVIYYLAVRSAGWTNAKLTPPAQPPHR
jgi:hypothetical protein